MAPVDWAPAPAAWAQAASGDLEGLLGRPACFEAAALRVAARDELLPGNAASMLVRLRTRGEAPEPLFFVLPRALALGIAGVRLGEAPEDAGEGALSESAQGAFVECAEVLVAALGRVFAELGELPELEHEASAIAAAGEAEAAGLADGRYRSQAFRLELDGIGDGIPRELALWLPEERAEAWFGPAPGGGEMDDERQPLAVIHPDPEVREQAEALSAALGRPVWSLDPAEFGPHSFDELRETEAVVVAWDLGGVPGLDLIDSLRGDPRTAERPVAIAMAAPTREGVLAALRWGAASVLQLPLDADEVKRRLGLG